MAKERPPTYRFSWLRLGNWKNFLRAELPLGQRVFLVGPNASGKSNLLDVFRFLRDLVSEGGGLQAAVNRRGGVKAIRCLAARQYPDIEMAVRIAEAEADDPSEFLWHYELVFNQDSRRRAVIKREKVVRRNPTTGKEEILLERPTHEDTADPERLTQTHLEQITMNQAFREVALFFASVRYLHIVPQLIREPDRSVGRKHDPYGGDFLEQIARTSEKTRNAWLRRIREALTVAVPQLQEIELWRDERGTPHLRAKYENWRLRGAWQTEEQLSDGTLRLLGLLWSLLEGRGPVLLEEPELSLHPEVIRYLPQMFARVQSRTGRQILTSTHSAELLQDEGIAPEEVVLLQPGREATEVRRVADIQEAKHLLKGGIPAGEIAVSFTKPERIEQLPRFGE
ncbi:MAG: chromosome segregation protein SMC [Bacteroidia bacterium]|nr:MAG: chromosome segregation protein SMC [Bacteroidia bacterium]